MFFLWFFRNSNKFSYLLFLPILNVTSLVEQKYTFLPVAVAKTNTTNGTTISRQTCGNIPTSESTW